MTYVTHIPETTYAQRAEIFRKEREQARESVWQLRVAHDALVESCEGHFQRNYVDYSVIYKAVKQIASLSHTIRGLALTAMQPAPPRHEPASAAYQEYEDRTYGGVKASRLVRVIRFIKNLRVARGEKRAAERVSALSDTLVNGLDIYGRVKALIRKLTDAVETPELLRPAREPATRRAAKPAFRWETTPKDYYGWKQARAVKGYDPRQTSVYWLETQANALKRTVHRAHHGIDTPRAKSVQSAERPSDEVVQVVAFTPPKGALSTDEIWPPIDLLRVIEDRINNCHLALDAGPHDAHVNPIVSGPRIKRGVTGKKDCDSFDADIKESLDIFRDKLTRHRRNKYSGKSPDD